MGGGGGGGGGVAAFHFDNDTILIDNQMPLRFMPNGATDGKPSLFVVNGTKKAIIQCPMITKWADITVPIFSTNLPDFLRKEKAKHHQGITSFLPV